MTTTDARGGPGAAGWGSAAWVTASQLSLAATSYVVLAASGRPLEPRGLAEVTAFYLLVNTVGRGLCSALELHLTRAVAADVANGASLRAASRAGARQAAVVLALALALVLAASPLLDRVFSGDVVLTLLLAASLPGMAFAYAARGLLAGRREYGRYCLSFAAEALTTAVVGAALWSSGQVSPRWWVLAFTLGPAVAVLALALVPNLPERSGTAPTAATRVRGLALSVVILGGSQAVWNLAPVVLTARLADLPAVAAGFAAVAVVLRVPVLLFPAAQAVLLPVLTGQADGGSGLLRGVPARWWALPVALSAAWLAVAVLVVPPLVRAAFGTSELPGAPALLLLAAATLVGGAAQLAQTGLVARGGYGLPALAWVLALVVLLVVGTVLPATVTLAALGVLAAVVLAAVVLAVPLLRPSTTRVLA